MSKEQENNLKALGSGDKSRRFVVGEEKPGLKRAVQGDVKSFDAKRAFEIVNMAENSANLQLQKAAQAQRA